MKEKKNYSLRFIQWGLKVLHLNLSEDKVHLSSYYIGGYSDGLAEELFVLCGNK